MAFYISPQVAIVERDLTLSITAAATSIGALVIRNPKRGREMQKVLITNIEQLIDEFGEPREDNVGNYHDILSARGALLHMNKLYCTSVRPKDASFAGVTSKYVPAADPSDPDEVEFVVLDSTGANSITLEDLDLQDPDYFADDVTPVGPVDVIAAARGIYGNRIRVAFISCDTYNKVVRNEKDITSYSFGKKLFSLDSALNQEDKRNFLVMVQYLPEGREGTKDIEWIDVERWNVSTGTKATDDLGTNMFCEGIINTQSKYIRIAINAQQKNSPWTLDHKDWIYLGGGWDGTPDLLTDGDIIKGYDLYSNAEEIDVTVFIEAGKSETVKRHLVDICESRKDCMAIIDCKYEHVVNNKGSETMSLVRWRKGLDPFIIDNFNINSDKCAMYANWLEVYDPWNSRYRWIPASGYVAGLWANTDMVAEPWYAPAGLNRAILSNDIRRLGYNPTLGERDLLYQAGWNPIVSFAGQGKVLWGQKTALDKSSAFNRINVRRLFNVLEKSIATSAKYYLFEPNDTATRIRLVMSIEPFLRTVKSRRGIYDYRIICDQSNNTPERIDAGELWCDILVKPVRSAEFIVLRFTAVSTGATFSEIVATDSSVVSLSY